VQTGLYFLAIQNTLVRTEGFTELAKIFAPAVRILSADLALHLR
jgi:hypothetical protein